MPRHPAVSEYEKHMAAEIQNRPCLYDRQFSEFHDAVCVKEAWAAVAHELNNEDVDLVQRQFVTLKKRYSCKRHDLRRASSNLSIGTSFTQEPSGEKYERALQNLEEYSFMNWLDPHTRHKSVKDKNNVDQLVEDYRSDIESSQPSQLHSDGNISNGKGRKRKKDCHILQPEASGPQEIIVFKTSDGSSHFEQDHDGSSHFDQNHDSSSHFEQNNDRTHFEQNHDGFEPIHNRTSHFEQNRNHSSHFEQNHERSSHFKQNHDRFESQEADGASTTHVYESKQDSHERNTSRGEHKVNAVTTVNTKDKDYIFGEMIASEIKGFPDHVKFQMKHEINNIIFKYHSQEFERQNNQ